MRLHKKLLIGTAFIMLFFLTGMTWAAPPNLINYQGALLDDLGNPVDGEVSLTFRLYADAEGGTPIWEETHQNVLVENGVYSVTLGDTEPLTSDTFSDTRYLSLSVNDHEEITPRTLVTGASSAIFAALPAGLACWDLNENGACDLAEEDINNDNTCDALDCQGAKGDQGDQGDPGDQGDKGDKGDPGVQGDKGDKGAQGQQGDPGEDGATGDKGAKGDPGPKGDKGDKGADGSSGLDAPEGALGYDRESMVIVQTTNDPTVNGQNLLAAISAAGSKTPHSEVLSATNRVAVIIPPGYYHMGTSALSLMTNYVDLIGMTTCREAQRIEGNSWLIYQYSDDIHFENLTFVGNFPGIPPYYVDGGFPNTIMKNCSLESADDYATGGNNFSGTYIDVYSTKALFAKAYLIGTFINCHGGDHSFESSLGTASGTLINCSGGASSFNAQYLSGTFTKCKAGDNSFGNGGTLSGTFINCEGGDQSFGFNGTASGKFFNCRAGTSSYGAGASGTATGEFHHCLGGSDSMPGTGGKFFYCIVNGTPK